MANPERGEIDLAVGDEVYTLSLTTHELCAMEKRTGQTYGQILSGLLTAYNVSAVRDFLRGALEPLHGKDLRTRSQREKVDVDAVVERMIDAATLDKVRETLLGLFTLNKPPADETAAAATSNGNGNGVEGTAANPPAASGGTGDSSMSTRGVSA